MHYGLELQQSTSSELEATFPEKFLESNFCATRCLRECNTLLTLTRSFRVSTVSYGTFLENLRKNFFQGMKFEMFS